MERDTIVTNFRLQIAGEMGIRDAVGVAPFKSQRDAIAVDGGCALDGKFSRVVAGIKWHRRKHQVRPLLSFPREVKEQEIAVSLRWAGKCRQRVAKISADELSR